MLKSNSQKSGFSLTKVISIFTRREIKLWQFALVVSFLNFILFHYPFFSFVFEQVDTHSSSGIILVACLIVLTPIANFFAFYLLLYLSKVVGKTLLVLFFILSAASVYFINTYGIIVDEGMIGNVLNTRSGEAGGFLSWKLFVYIILLGILPSIYIVRARIIRPKFKKFIVTFSLTLLLLLVFIFANATNWLWIDKNSKQLGGLVMPWSYTINLALFYKHKQDKNEKEILLPEATIKNNKKAIVVLVIGESARRENFSLLGYKKNTNPLLSQTENLKAFDATSCGTYTTVGVKCILEHKNSSKLYEPLPNYLYRTGVDVIWRTTNWGEPPIHIAKYEDQQQLRAKCKGENCDYDEVLLSGLKEEILASKKDKIFIVLHTSTSHGPTYYKKYPSKFEVFTPVCKSVDLGNCSRESLLNAYDNSIVYTDFLLHSLIEDLKQFKEYDSTMLFVSDHGESLGENNLYTHGLPRSIAPKEQYQIPFIVWVSNDSKHLKPYPTLTQSNVFHSVLNFLDIQSPIYNEELNIFK